MARRKKAAPPAPAPAPKVTKNPARDRRDDPEPDGSSELELAREDAARIVSNRTFGRVDDTLDPVDVLAALLAAESELYSQEQFDTALEETERARDTASERAETAERERDAAVETVARLQANAATDRAAYAAAVADAIQARDTALDFERQVQIWRAVAVGTRALRHECSEGESSFA